METLRECGVFWRAVFRVITASFVVADLVEHLLIVGHVGDKVADRVSESVFGPLRRIVNRNYLLCLFAGVGRVGQRGEVHVEGTTFGVEYWGKQVFLFA